MNGECVVKLTNTDSETTYLVCSPVNSFADTSFIMVVYGGITFWAAGEIFVLQFFEWPLAINGGRSEHQRCIQVCSAFMGFPGCQIPILWMLLYLMTWE